MQYKTLRTHMHACVHTCSIRRQIKCFEGHTDCIWDVAAHNTHHSIFTASADGTVKMWNVQVRAHALSDSHIDAISCMYTLLYLVLIAKHSSILAHKFLLNSKHSSRLLSVKRRWQIHQNCFQSSTGGKRGISCMFPCCLRGSVCFAGHYTRFRHRTVITRICPG
jgi:WD40 repeat protein